MENLSGKQQEFDAAQKRINKIRSFYRHLAAYCSINIILLILWAFDSYAAQIFWERTFFITAGLGTFGVLAHAIATFGSRYVLPKGWEERKIKKLMYKEQKKQS